VDGVAYLLDPHFVGEHLTQDEEDKITTFIVNYVNSDIDPNATVPVANSEGARNLIKETSDLRMKMKDELNSFLAAARERKFNKNDKFNNLPTHPKDYWKINQRHYPNLYTLALKVFNIPAGTASSAVSEHFQRKVSFDPSCIIALTLTKSRKYFLLN
jgi:hypothetical protein